MGIGHLGLAFASKRYAPRASLGVLLLAGILPDLIWTVALAAGIERARIVPGITAASPFEFISYPISHSLVATLVWAALFGGAYFMATRDRAAAGLMAAGVASHWLLDVASHRPDVPVLPRGPYWGLGLWNSLPATLAVEAAILLAGVIAYARFTAARDRTGRLGLGMLVGFLLFAHFAAYLGPPPPSMNAVVAWNLFLALPLVGAAFVDRHRVPRIGRK